MFGERLRASREAAGLSQLELANRAGVSRQLVGAAEAGRHLPRVDAAVALARAVGVPIESLLGPGDTALEGVTNPVPDAGQPVQVGRVGERLVCAAPPSVGDGWGMADAIVGGSGVDGSGVEMLPGARARAVVVGCDPAIVLANRLVSGGGTLLTVTASTRAAVTALARGRTHAAVVHGRPGSLPDPPGPVRRHHLARWQVGLAAPQELPGKWWRDALGGRRRVVQREEGAGSQAAFARAVAAAGGPAPDGPRASGHLEAARWAQLSGTVAVTIEPAALAGGLAFHPLEEHVAELWVAEQWSADPAIVRLCDVLESAGFRRRLAVIGGYDLAGCGGREDDG